MNGFTRPFAMGKMLLVLFGAALLTSVSVGGWKLLSGDEEAAPVNAVLPNEPLAPCPEGNLAVETPSLREEAVVAVTKPARVVESLVSAEPEPAKREEPRKKEPTKGKDHERPDALLTSMIQQLHSKAYRQFIGAPGFGRNREIPLMTIKNVPWKSPEWTSEELAKEPPPLNGAKDLSLIHRLSVNRFADSNATTPSERAGAGATKKEYLWQIKSLDLVGLVMHETPVVYMSLKVPQMQDLKNKATRPLDLFESEGIEELSNGKDIYIRSKEGAIRVLGPIHAGKACLKCHHDSKEGAMLGAFSYTLRVGEYQLVGRGGGQYGLPNGGFRPGIQPLPTGYRLSPKAGPKE